MAVQDKGNDAWKTIKSSSLILAEGGNLLLFRGSEADRDDWVKHATTIRELGGQLYQAAKSKDEKKSQEVYKLMIQNCNDCHQQFAGGDPQLKP